MNTTANWLIVLLWLAAGRGMAADLIPPGATIQHDRPRLLLRPTATPNAVSLAQLRGIPRDPDWQQMLRQLEELRPARASALALAYQLTGRNELAERALTVMRGWRRPVDRGAMNDPFNVYFTLLDLALAYDWLHDYPGFDEPTKAALRQELRPFTDNAFRLGDDHVFHNYIWMYNCGAMLWALATAGDDPEADRLLAGLRERFNRHLFPAMEYLGGANGDSAGYWWLYCQNPGLLVLLATQSAFETDVVGAVRRERADWLSRQLDCLLLSILPDLRLMPWGDCVAGANGGVTHEMAAKLDALTWALKSPSGTFVSRWLDRKRGRERFYGETAIFYFLYTRQLDTEPGQPPLAVLSGDHSGGQVILRSDWTDQATVVGFRCTDFFGQHHHLDQGSFVIYRRGWLALDAGTYRQVGGPQSRTDAHNTFLFGGQGQRRQTYQSANTLEAFTRRLPKGLDTGDILFYHDAGPWTATAGQFAQAYAPGVIRSCVRQLLFVRPDKVVVVDDLEASPGQSLPEIQWLLQVPRPPVASAQSVLARNGSSFLRCHALLPPCQRLTIEDSYRSPAGPNSAGGNPTMIDASRVIFRYEGKPRLVLVHLLEVGDGDVAKTTTRVHVRESSKTVRLELEGQAYEFSLAPPFAVAVRNPASR